MKVFVQCDKNGLPLDYDFFNAYAGFKEMGFEIVFFHKFKKNRKKLAKNYAQMRMLHREQHMKLFDGF